MATTNNIRVSGNIISGLGGSATSAAPNLAAINKKTKFTTNILAYPLNVDNPSGSGHYIIFRINRQDKAKLASNKAKSSIKEFEKQLKLQFAILDENFAVDDDSGGGDDQPQRDKIRQDLLSKLGIVDFDKTKATADSAPAGKKGSSSIQLQNPTTTRTDTAIALYMPQTINTAYSATYEEENISAGAETIAVAVKAAMGGNFRAAAAAGLSGGETMIRQAAVKALDTVAPGASALIALERGRVITPRIELMFKSMNRREFSYEFNFIPKSAQEAKKVEEIILEFKKNMAADFLEGGVSGVREMSIPSNFDIEYMYKGQRNTHLNKISTCVLKNISVSYGGDKFVAYDGGVPQSTKISLTFTELEIITRSHIEKEGY